MKEKNEKHKNYVFTFSFERHNLYSSFCKINTGAPNCIELILHVQSLGSPLTITTLYREIKYKSYLNEAVISECLL